MSNSDIRGSWQTLACTKSPTARHENGFVECNGKFYLIGGRGIKPVDEFDPATNTWRQLSPSPLELHHHQPVAIGETIYLVGAMTGGYPRETPVEQIYLYHPAEDRWEQGPAIPKERQRGAASTVVHNGKIYLVCGIKDGHYSGTINWFDAYDPVTDTWEILPDAPHVRDHAPAAMVGHKLFVVGGRNTSVHTEDNFAAFFHATVPEVDYYDFGDGKWYVLEEALPIGTAAGGIAVMENQLLYFGGETGHTAAHDETQCYNFDRKTWENLASMQRGRHGSQAVVYEGGVYMVAGCGNRGGSPELDSIERFSLGT